MLIDLWIRVSVKRPCYGLQVVDEQGQVQGQGCFCFVLGSGTGVYRFLVSGGSDSGEEHRRHAGEGPWLLLGTGTDDTCIQEGMRFTEHRKNILG